MSIASYIWLGLNLQGNTNTPSTSLHYNEALQQTILLLVDCSTPILRMPTVTILNAESFMFLSLVHIKHFFPAKQSYRWPDRLPTVRV